MTEEAQFSNATVQSYLLSIIWAFNILLNTDTLYQYQYKMSILLYGISYVGSLLNMSDIIDNKCLIIYLLETCFSGKNFPEFSGIETPPKSLSMIFDLHIERKWNILVRPSFIAYTRM
jgi:hypothetical protein